MQRVKYDLVKIDDNSILSSYTDDMPTVIKLPSGSIIQAPALDADYEGYKLIKLVNIYNPVPEQVPMWKVRTILQKHNLFDKVQSLITASTDTALKNLWEYGNDVYRSSTTINNLASTLGLSSTEVDDLFIEAGSIKL